MTATTTTSSPPRACAYMGKRATAGFSEINLDNLDSLDTTSQISNKDGCEVSDYAKHHVISSATIKAFVNLVLRDPLVQTSNRSV